jgi:hypothetical protein
MSRKPKFKPEITRVKLNPEQAVLSCTCYFNGSYREVGTGPIRLETCEYNTRTKLVGYYWVLSTNMSS